MQQKNIYNWKSSHLSLENLLRKFRNFENLLGRFSPRIEKSINLASCFRCSAKNFGGITPAPTLKHAYLISPRRANPLGSSAAVPSPIGLHLPSTQFPTPPFPTYTDPGSSAAVPHALDLPSIQRRCPLRSLAHLAPTITAAVFTPARALTDRHPHAALIPTPLGSGKSLGATGLPPASPSPIP